MKKYKLGTMLIDENNIKYKYAKVDFGILAEDTKTKKVYRHIEYMWIPVLMKVPKL